MIRTERLTKEFLTGFWRPRPNRGLDGLTLDVPAGEVFGLLGPNGAGKSTTLKLLLNLLRPTSGRVEVLRRPPGDVVALRRIGFLPENPTFYDHLSAEELLTYFSGLFGYSGADRTRRVSETLDRVGLGADRRRPIRQYSKGMVQRVGLAQAIVNEPELVILDEPMSGLDPIGRREVREIIQALTREGRTILFSSHILSDAEMLCTRVGILSKGRLVAAGRLDELLSDDARAAEVIATHLPDALMRELGASATVVGGRPGHVTIRVDTPASVDALLVRLITHGATVVSVTPIRATLEDVFLEALRSGGGAAA